MFSLKYAPPGGRDQGRKAALRFAASRRPGPGRLILFIRADIC